MVLFSSAFPNNIRTVASLFTGDWYLVSSCGGFIGGCRYPGANDSVHLIVSIDTTDSGSLANPVLSFKFYNKDTIIKFGVSDSISTDSFHVGIIIEQGMVKDTTVPSIVMRLHERSSVYQYNVRAFGEGLKYGDIGADNTLFSYAKPQINSKVRHIVQSSNTAVKLHQEYYLINGKKIKQSNNLFKLPRNKIIRK
jgi:hypothetical protein